MLLTIKPTFIRPRVTLRAKKDNFIEPTEAPGEGNRRFPSMDQSDIEPDKNVNPLKKFIMDVFKIKEVDYEEFRKKSKWAIRPNKKH